jgi:hypothetical protein
MLDQQPRYDSYKESGVPWIGAVPTEWSVLPGRACLYESRDKNTGMKEDTVLSLSYGRVSPCPRKAGDQSSAHPMVDTTNHANI